MAVETCRVAVLWEGDLCGVFPSPLPQAKTASGFSTGRWLSLDQGSVEKEVWQHRLKISVFLPFAVT